MDRTDSAESDEKADAEAGSTPWYERAYDRFEKWNQEWNPTAVDLDDPDGDGLSRSEEAEHGTFDFTSDSDGDGIEDGDEVAAGSNPLVDDADADPDRDGLTNAEEVEHGTRADQADTDGDGLLDGDEVRVGLSPTDVDTDGDLLTDGFEVFESKTDPRRVDSEGDGVDDALRDPDGDGAPNLKEQIRGTDPLNAISDPASEKTDGGEPVDEFLRRNAAEARDTITEADAAPAEVAARQATDSRSAEPGEQEGGYELVGDGDADYEFVPAGLFGAKTGHGVVLDRETLEEVEGRLPPGTKVLYQHEKWRFRKNLTEDEADGTRGDDRSRMDTEPPPAGEREPGGWDGEGEGEDAVEGVGDPTSMRIGIDEPVVEGAEASVIDLLNGGDGRTAGTDLGGSTPAATPDDPSPLGKSVDPAQVAAERFGRGATSIFEGTGAAAATDPTPSGGAVAAVRTSRLDQDGVGGAGRDTTGQGDSGTTQSGDGEEATESDEASSDEEDSHDDGQENDEGGSTEEDETEDETEPDVRESVNEYDPETGETTTYYVDEAGNVYDQNGNPVPPDQVPAWVRDAASSSGGDGGGESGDSASSGGVSTTVDPDGGFGDRTKGEAIEDELGAPDGAPRDPVDPQRWEGTIEDRSLRDLITNSDLAQPVPGEVAAAGGEAPSVNSNASGGRFGTGAIDWGPDHVTNETGPYEDEQVPEAARTSDGDGDEAGEADPDALTPVQQGIALTAEPVNEPEPLQAIATDGREQGLAPQEPDDADDPYDEPQWDESADTVPPYPEVADDGFGDRLDGLEPEPAPVEIDVEPDRFEVDADLL